MKISIGKKGKDDKPWFDGRDIRHIHCVRPGRCEKLKNTTCFGSKLPYQFTSLDLTDSLNQDESRERLYNYEALRNIPKCWAVIQVCSSDAFTSVRHNGEMFNLIVMIAAISLCSLCTEMRATWQSRYGVSTVIGNVSNYAGAVPYLVQHNLFPGIFEM